MLPLSPDDQAVTGKIPGQTIPPENDNGTKNNPPGEGSLFEKIVGAAHSAAESVKSAIKPGRGRPRKDGSPKKSDKFTEATPPPPQPDPQFFNTPPPPPNNPGLDSAVIELCCTAGWEGGVRFADKKIERRMAEKSGDPAYAKAYVSDVTLTDREKGALGTVTKILYEKYVGQMSPEGAACMLVIGLASRYLMAIADTAKEKEEVIEVETVVVPMTDGKQPGKNDFH